jgi:hypothetical protein
MKKMIENPIQITVCDECGKEDLSTYVSCDICGKELCTDCMNETKLLEYTEMRRCSRCMNIDVSKYTQKYAEIQELYSKMDQMHNEAAEILNNIRKENGFPVDEE